MSSTDQSEGDQDPKRTLYNLKNFINRLCPSLLVDVEKNNGSKSSYMYNNDYGDDEDGDTVIALKEKLKILKKCYSTTDSIDSLNKFALSSDFSVLLVECIENEGFIKLIY